MPKNAEQLALAFMGRVVAHPKAVLLAFLAGTAALGSFAPRFKIDAGADTLLTKDNKYYIQSKVMDRRFGSEEFLLVAYKPRNRPVLSEGTFKDLRALKQRFLTLERVESVRCILDVPLPPPGAFSADADLSQWTIEKKGFAPDEIKKLLRDHPIYEDLLINKDQTATALQILFKKDEALRKIESRITTLQVRSLEKKLSREDRDALRDLKKSAEPIQARLDNIRSQELESIRKIVGDYSGEADIYLGGIHALGHQLIEIITNDLLVFGAAIGGMICLVLYVLFRKLRWVFIAALCCACSLISTIGLFGLIGLKATVISSSFVALQLILTLAISVHLVVQYREYIREHPDWDQAELVRQTLSRKAIPCFYAGFTNIVGFGSLLFSGLKPVIDFGWMMSMAMLLSIATTLVLFPALMAMFKRESGSNPPVASTRLLEVSARWSLKRSWWIVLLSGGVLAVSAVGLFRLNVENSFINYFRASTDVRKELTFIDREFGGTTPLDLTYTVPPEKRKKDLVLTAENVLMLQRIQAALERHKAMGKTLSVVNFTELAKRLNDNKPITEYELTALYLTLEKDLRKDLVGSFLSPEDSQLRITTRVKDTTPGLNRATLVSEIKSDMKKLGIKPDQYQLTGLFVLYQDILQQLFSSQILTLGVSFGVLALAILLIFRSIKLALICIVPNVLSTVIVLGLMGWLGIPLDFMTIMIAAIAMGITVDDTIHYVDRYLEELRGGSKASEKAVTDTHSSVGHALLFTSLIVILGFALLAFSKFVPSVLFGLLTSLAMALAVLFDLTLLPAMLNKFVKRA